MTKKIVIILGIILLIVVVTFSLFLFSQKPIKLVEKHSENTKEIKKHYGKNVLVEEKCDLYRKEGEKYVSVGKVYPNEIFGLSDVDDFTKEYFPIEGRDLFISYRCVQKSDQEKIQDSRFQNYIPFSESIKSKEKVTLYQNDKPVYTLDFKIEEPIIKKDANGYFIKYWEQLFFVKKEDILEVVENGTSSEYATEIPVVAYHFIYAEGDDKCYGIICHPVSQVESHFQYLRNNQFFTITTKEMEDFLDEKIRLPKKSILITIDDGDRAENVLPLLEKYQVNATLFLITSWYFSVNYPSPYLEFGSHTHALHNTGVCSGGQGSPLKCLPFNEVVEDLKTSKKEVNTDAFCFPFYEYNQQAIEAVKQAGFHLGFVGGQKKATLTSDKFTIPRITLYGDTTLDEYIQLIN